MAVFWSERPLKAVLTPSTTPCQMQPLHSFCHNTIFHQQCTALANESITCASSCFLPLSVRSESLQPSVWQKPLLLQSVSSSNPRSRKVSSFSVVSYCSACDSLARCSFPVWSWATGSHRPQSASASGVHFGYVSVRDHYILQPHMHSPILLW